MMLNILNLTIKNFLSIGNVTQTISFTDSNLTIVLGENLDLGGNDSRNGVGKAQPFYSGIKTPTGWTTMGEIEVGDKVTTPDGGVATVTGVFPQGKIPVYRMTFKDGRTADCCLNHLWTVMDKLGNTETMSTDKIKDKLTHRSFFIPLVTHQFAHRDKDPHLLAYHDGSTFFEQDNRKELLAKYQSAPLSDLEDFVSGLTDSYIIVNNIGQLTISSEEYDTIRSLQRMFWTLGYVAELEFDMMIPYYLVITGRDLSRLSKLATIKEYYKEYCTTISGLKIQNIEYVDDIESKCIMIDHPDHLYITDDYIVTHNTAIANALSYALYGEALVRIKKDNLINKTNARNMLVTVDFEKNGINYHIERGRKPAIFKFMVNGALYGDTATDEAQGESRVTQQEIERVLQISSDMFKQIICLNTYNEPYLSMRSADQRVIIEQLLGITMLSEKSLALKDLIRGSKDDIKLEEAAIASIKSSNQIIQNNIASLQAKSNKWQETKDDKLLKYADTISALENIDVEVELDSHRQNATNKEIMTELKNIERDRNSLRVELEQHRRVLATVNNYLASDSTKICPVCTQEMDRHNHAKVLDDYKQQKATLEELVSGITGKIQELDSILNTYKPGDLLPTFYSSIDDAYDHKSKLVEITNSLVYEYNTDNPYLDQINILEQEGLKEISYEVLDKHNELLGHQEFLFKLLTDKDSFIRKKIIDQSVGYLNKRLGYYLEKLALPHQVKFKSDLDVEITNCGRDFDFDNLSRGERTRLILSLSWAFRDIFENLNGKINICFIDEMLDSGLDTAGVENSLEILKKMVREQRRTIFLVSHRDELASRVNSVLKVTKENGFTTFDQLE